MNALLLLAVLATNPKPCAKEEAEHAAALAYLSAAHEKVDAADDSTERRYAEHMEVIVARRRLADAVDALATCLATKAVKP